MATLIEVESDSSFQSQINAATEKSLQILYFKASWAAPCAQMTKILQTLASTYPADNSVQFLAIDAENLPDISESYDVTSVPHIVLQRAGKVLQTIGGSDAAKVRSAVEKYAGQNSSAGTNGIPPALEATPQANGSTTKSLGQYAPTTAKDAAPSETTSDKTTTKEELNTRLSNLVKAAPVMLFMKGTPSAPQCGFSRQLVSILRENSVKYGFFNILADDEVRQGLKEFSDWPTFPQLYTKGELIGGLDIVKEELDSDPDFFTEFSVKSSASGGSGITA